MQAFEFRQEVAPVGAETKVLETLTPEAWEFLAAYTVPAKMSALDVQVGLGVAMLFRRPLKDGVKDAGSLQDERPKKVIA